MAAPKKEYGYERNGVCGMGGIACTAPASEQSIFAIGMYVCEGCHRYEKELKRSEIAYTEKCELDKIAARFEFRVSEVVARMAWGDA